MPNNNELNPLTGLPVGTKVDAKDIKLPSSITGNIENAAQSELLTTDPLSKYTDRGIDVVPNTNLREKLADSQGVLEQAKNSVVGGTLSGLATAVQDFSYIPQLFSSHWEENAVSDAMIRAKEGIDEELPIYTKTDGMFDWNDGAFVWKALKGTLDSAIGFGLPGGAIAEGLGTLGKVAKLEQGIQKLGVLARASKLEALGNLLYKSPTVYKAAMSLGSGYIMNRMEGTMMGVELYNKSMKEMEGDIASGKITQADAERVASQKADEFRNWNTMFAITDAIGVHGIIKGDGFTRNLQSKGWGLTEMSMENPILQALKEGGEEIGQNIIQSEKEYETYKDLGLKGKANALSNKQNLAGRILDFGTSQQALYEGMLGLVGGYPQHVLSTAASGGYTSKARQEKEDYYNAQQKTIADTEAYLKGFNDINLNYSQLKAEALKKGDTKAAEALDKMNFTNQVVKAFSTGTTESFERNLDDIINLTPDKAKERGYNPDYSSKAQSLKKEMLTLEADWINTSHYINHEEVFQAKQTAKINQELYNNELEKSNSKANAVNNEASRLIQKYNNRITKEKGHDTLGLSFDLDHIDNPNLSSELLKPYYNEFVNELKGTPAYDDYFSHKITELKQTEDALDEINNHYKTITSSKYQEAVQSLSETIKEKKKEAEAKTKKEEAKAKHKEVVAKVKEKVAAVVTPKVTAEKTPVTTPDLNTPISLGNIQQEEEIVPTPLSREDMYSQLEDLYNTHDALLQSSNPDQNKLAEIGAQIQKLEEEINKTEATEATSQDNNVSSKEELEAQLADANERYDIANYSGNVEDFEAAQAEIQSLTKQLKDLEELTPTEETVVVQTDAQQEEVTANEISGQEYTDDTNDDVEETNIATENFVEKEDLEEEEYFKSEFGSNILAYLSRLYNGFTSREDIDNLLNEELKDKSILDPDKFQPGTKITLRVKDNDATDMYIPGTKDKTTWGEYKIAHPEIKVGTEAYNNLVPIVILDTNGNEIADLHTTDWIRTENIFGDVQEDSIRLSKIRKHILANNGKLDSIITRKTNGKLFKLINGAKETIAKAFPDKNLHIVYSKKGELKNVPTKVAEATNMQFVKDGITYIVVPVNKNSYIPLPLQQKKVSTEIAQSITTAISIWYKAKGTASNLDSNNRAIAEAIYTETGLNITQNEDLRKYVTLFINSYDIPAEIEAKIPKDSKESKLKIYLEGTSVKSTTHLLSITGNTIDFGTGAKFTGSLFHSTPENVANDLIGKLTSHIENMYLHINHSLLTKDNVKMHIINSDGTLSDINNNGSYKDFVRNNTETKYLSHNIGTEENPKYVYTIQPVIEYDTSFVDDANTRINNELQAERNGTKTEITKANENIAKITNPLTGEEINIYKDSFDEDFLPLTDEQASVVVNSFKNTILVPGLTANQQQEIVNDIAYLLQRKVLEANGKTINGRDVHTEYKAYLESLLAITTGKRKEVIQAVIDNYKSIENISYKYFSKLQGVQVKENVDNLFSKNEEDTKVNVDEETDISNETESNLEKTTFEDSSLTQNYKNTISSRLKKFLSFIKTGEKNFVYSPQFVPFDEVYNTLKQVLSGERPDFDGMIKELEKNVISKPWLQDVVTQLNAAPGETKNDFVSAMTSHTVNMTFLMWQKDANDNYKLTPYSSNSVSISNMVIDNWYETGKLAAVVIDKEGELVYNPEVVARYKVAVQNLKDKKLEDITVTDVANTFATIGIELHPDALKTFLSKGLSGQSFKSHLISKTGIFANLSNKLSSTNDIVTDNYLGDKSITKLAYLEAKFNKNVTDGSFKSGTKSISAHTLNKHITNQVRELKNNRKLVTDMLSISFSKDSSLLKGLVFTEVNEDVKNEAEKVTGSREVTVNKQGVVIASDGQILYNKDSYFYQNFNFDYLGIEAIKEFGKSSKDGSELKNLSAAEHELIKIGLFMKSSLTQDSKGNRVAQMFYPTMSDKTTMINITTLLHNVTYGLDGTLSNKTVDALFDALVLPEYNRMVNYHGAKNIKGYDKGHSLFYFLPQLNDRKELFHADGTIKDLSSDKDALIIIKNEIRNTVEDLVKGKLTEWETYKFTKDDYLDADYMKNTAKKNIKYAATDYVVNYLIHNSNMFQAFIGDPALYFKSDSDNNMSKIEDTFINIGKRLAGDIAPGYEINNAYKDTFKAAIIADRKSVSESIDYYTKVLKEKGAEAYTKIEAGDAQEYTTLREHLKVMYGLGKITEKNFNRINALANEGKDLSDADLALILQPMKPVYVANRIELHNDLNRRIYIKSSSFPLVPQLTRGLQIDNLRVAMEHPTTGVDRVSFGTAAKVGAPNNQLNIFDDNGDFNSVIDFSQTEVLTLSRSGFRIQQEVPYDKEKINVGTQERKLLFVNLLDTPGFNYKDKKNISGKELQEIYTDKYHKLFQLQHKSLMEELEFNEATGKVNTIKLQKLLKKEAIERDFPINDILGLELDRNGEFRIPLWLLPSTSRYESLLNAIVDNRVRKMKFNGASFILGSEEGFKEKPTVVTGDEAQDKIDELSSDIVYTDSWTGKLKGTTEHGMTQALIPFKFRDSNGELLDISKYTLKDKKNGKLMLDTNKLPKDLLKIFGFRIPTQGLNSMAQIEIVGFLPVSAGDLIITSKDFTKQMGSDFDVDKLYSYIYSHVTDASGAIHKITSDNIEQLINFSKSKSNKKEELGEKDILKLKQKFEMLALHNEILDIHHAVLENTHEDVRKQMLSPLGFGDLKDGKDLANLIASWKKARSGTQSFNGLSDSYQKQKFLNATDGKGGTGVFSLDSVFNSLVQGKDLHYIIEDTDGFNTFSVKFGNLESTGFLSDPKTLDGKKYKSDVIAAYQSASVDNEKEQILDKLNINSNTYDVIRILAQLGFDEETISAFTNQDIIVDLVKEIKLQKSSLYGYQPDLEATIIEQLTKKYTEGIDTKSESFINAVTAKKNISTSELMSYIQNGKTNDNFGYAAAQIASLSKFKQLTEYGKTLKRIQSAINTDSAGLGKSLFASIAKEESVRNLQNTPVKNAEKLIGNYTTINGKLEIEPTTINGFATVYGLFTNNSLWSKYFPYGHENIANIVTEINKVTSDKEMDTAQKEEVYKNVFGAIKSYLFTRKDLGVFDGDLKARREWLFKNLGKKINEFKLNKTKIFETNPFLNKLTTETDLKSGLRILKYNAVSLESFFEDSIYGGFLDLIQKNTEIADGYTTRQLADDFVQYAYLSGGKQQAVDFIRYIPIEYLNQLPFANKLRNINFSDTNVLDNVQRNDKTPYYQVSEFVKQYVQHNSRKAPEFPETTKVEYTNKEKTQFTLAKDAITLSKMPVFVNFNDKLWQFNGQNYTQISKLGGKYQIGEYDANSRGITSIVSKQNPKQLVSADTNIFFKADSTGNVIENTTKKPYEDVIVARNKKYMLESGSILNVLDAVSGLSKNPAYKRLASEYHDVIANLDYKIDIRLSDVNAFGRTSYNIDGKGHAKIEINNTKVIDSVEALEKTILHETTHALTKFLVMKYERDPESLTVQQREIVGKLDKFRLLYKARIGNELVDITWNKKEKGIPLSEEERNFYYPGSNLQEFTAAAMENEEFQKYLAKEIWQGEKSFLDKFFELVRDLMKSLGIKPGEDLNKYIYNDVLSLIKSQVKQEVIEQPIQNKEGIDFVFEQNPELANEVYEALGFRNKHWSGHTISTFNKAANEFINKFKGKFPFRIVGSAALSLNNKLDRVPNDIDLLVEDTYSSVFYGGAEINENSPKFVQEIKKVYGQTYITGGFDDVSGALLYIPELNLYIEPKFYSKEQLDSDKSLVQDVTNIKDEKKIWNEEILQITPQQKQQALQQYSQYLESLNKPNTNPILQGNQTNVEEIITQLEKDGLLEIDCKGKLKAKDGLRDNFTKGGKWKVIKDLKGYPTHKKGGVDLTIGKDGVKIKNSNTEFTAKHGLVIPKN